MNESLIMRLDESVASRIAAGEVIERPVSAAKELIENSVDSGASDIRIILEQGGKASIVVEDDGCGIRFAEMPLALERYATSKIRDIDDLDRVRTLGYRGEALSSMAAVSRLEIRSMTREAAAGGMIRCEGGVITAHSELQAAFGTRIQIDDLFYNLPARRKFMKAPTTELKRIIQVAQDYAVANPRVRFRVTNDGKAILDIGGAASSGDVIASVWGDEGRTSFVAVTRGAYSLSMWYNGMPGARRVNVTSFVNGRRVQDATIRSAISSTGGSIYGDWIVMLTAPPEDVDVNIHPAKAEIRFRKSGPIFEMTNGAAKELLMKSGGFSRDVSIDAPAPFDPWENYVPPAINNDRKTIFPSRPESGGVTERSQSGNLSPSGALFSDEPRRRYLGQAQGGYLVFDDAKGLCLLDPHAAHERILYEEIEEAFGDKSIPSQRLVIAQPVPGAIAASVAEQREVLLQMGFAFHLPGDDGYDGEAVISALPAVRGLGRLTPVEMLRSALRGIDEESDPSKRDREVWWRWARTACRDAVKLGEVMGEREAMELFEKLERCRSPYSCPHGRPTTIFFGGEQLKNWFER
ncbi:DNA mismatch repair protein MutL [Synergistales bacterium]|nr:DNA mismatch repair protein MutL [Synergistales bacterium]